MANTYTLIASNTLGSTAAEVNFTNIPGTYTDLILRFSTRSTFASTLGTYNQTSIDIALNQILSGATLSNTNLYGNGSTATSDRTNSGWMNVFAANPGTNGTSNTFSNGEWYLPSYTGSQNKIASAFSVQENNTVTTGPFVNISALRDSRTTSITSLKIASGAGSFDIGSSFFLYGIKNT